MNGLARLLGAELQRRLKQRYPKASTMLAVTPVLSPLLALAACFFLAILAAAVLVAGQNSGGCGTTVAVAAPGAHASTAKQFVTYFESQGMRPAAAAGIVGNLQQESVLKAQSPGGGLAQWGGSRWGNMIAWTTRQGYPGDSPDPVKATDGQLMFIVYDLRTSYAGLLAAMNTAGDAGTAATMFETTYELCSGVTGYMQVSPGSLCNDPARRQYASQAYAASGGTTVFASVPTSGRCVASGGPAGDPIPNFRASRDDRGVDAYVPSHAPLPILAPAPSVLVEILPGWYAGQPLMLFRFDPPLAGTYQGDQYWYVAEEITPVSIASGTTFAAGQPVATYAPSGSGIEIGWGSPTTNSRGLVQSDANPPRGTLTPEAEAFKVFFHIPWVGQSPS